jgi:hypothetical protein
MAGLRDGLSRPYTAPITAGLPELATRTRQDEVTLVDASAARRMRPMERAALVAFVLIVVLLAACNLGGSDGRCGIGTRLAGDPTPAPGQCP